MQNIDFTLKNTQLKAIFEKMHESDIAVLFEDNIEQRFIIFDAVGIKRFGKIFSNLSEDIAVKFFMQLPQEIKKSLIRYLEIDELKTFIEYFRVSDQNEILSLLSKSTLDKVKKLLSYAEDTAGSISSPHFMVDKLDKTVKEVTEFVVKESDEKSEIDVIFFEDENKVFAGAIKLIDLIVARGNQPIQRLIDEKYPYVYDDDTTIKSIKKIRNYDIHVLPVLNAQQQLIGIITSDDALFVMEEEHIEAVESLVQLHGHDEDEPAFKRSMKRLPWLLASITMNLVIASFLSVFQNTLDSNVALVLFQPMILSMAGNIATQSIAVTILEMHKDKVNAGKHIFKEFMIALINSMIAGLLGIFIAFLFLWLLPQEFAEIEKMSFVVGISIMISMFISAMVGVILPFILRKLGADEKAASGPIISTVNDFFALGIYFLIATLLLTVV